MEGVVETEWEEGEKRKLGRKRGMAGREVETGRKEKARRKEKAGKGGNGEKGSPDEYVILKEKTSTNYVKNDCKATEKLPLDHILVRGVRGG